MSAKEAILNYARKQLPSTKKKRVKKNSKPEKLVESACLKWMRSKGWHAHIYESKAVWNASAGKYLAPGNLPDGHSDCAGITNFRGVGHYVEFKAKGKLSTFNLAKNNDQRDFLIEKIHMKCFAVVVDSMEQLATFWFKWTRVRVDLGEGAAVAYLLDSLPQRRSTDVVDLF